MDLNIDKLSSTTKNIFYIIGVVAMGTIAYNQIFSNQAAIEQLKIDTQHEFVLQQQRSDKRYKRAMGLGKDHEARLRKVETTVTYIKGKEGY